MSGGLYQGAYNQVLISGWHISWAVFEFKDFQVVVQRASRFDFSVARKNFDLPVFISKFRYKILILKVYRDAESVK